jgi:hypothetical protein
LYFKKYLYKYFIDVDIYTSGLTNKKVYHHFYNKIRTEKNSYIISVNFSIIRKVRRYFINKDIYHFLKDRDIIDFALSKRNDH